MIRCTRVYQPTGYFCILGGNLGRILYHRPMLIVDVFLWMDFGCFSYRGLHLLYRRFHHCLTEELLGVFSFLSRRNIVLVLVGINEVLGTRTLLFSFLYTVPQLHLAMMNAKNLDLKARSLVFTMGVHYHSKLYSAVNSLAWLRGTVP